MSVSSPASFHCLAALALGGVLSITGCERGAVTEIAEGPSMEELVAYYSPEDLKILPFTKAKSFDDDAIPDGLGVSLRTYDADGDTVKAYGTFVFELYAYRPASADHRGELLRQWTQSVTDPAAQKQFWERVTTTYEFQLSWEGEPLRPEQRYIITATFQAPGAKRLFDDYEFEFRVRRQEILDALGGAKS